MPELFPDLLNEEQEAVLSGKVSNSPKSLSYDECCITIKTLTNIAAACAIAADIDMGRAFVRASNEILAETMKRWPNPPEPIPSVAEQVQAAAIQLRTAKMPQQTETIEMIVKVVANTAERRAVSVNGGEYILVGPNEEREFAVPDDGSEFTISVAAGNRYDAPVMQEGNQEGPKE